MPRLSGAISQDGVQVFLSTGLKHRGRNNISKPKIVTTMSLAATVHQILIKHFHMYFTSHRLARWRYYHCVPFTEQSDSASKVIELVGGRARSRVTDHLFVKRALSATLYCLPFHQAIYSGQTGHLPKLRIQPVALSFEVILLLVSASGMFLLSVLESKSDQPCL